ncbi:hypothetical protein GF340_05735, partial [Candidatus Peregrinibacteria bacterium]|nr:hypothetical protein [Candidatus Peregrinibacteria bacterium]
MKKSKSLIANFSPVLNGRVVDVWANQKNISVSGAGNFSAKSFLFADVIRRKKAIKQMLWVVNDKVEQQNVYKALEFYSDLKVYSFDVVAEQSDGLKKIQKANKISALEFVLNLKKDSGQSVTIANYQDLCGSFPDFDELDQKKMVLQQGEDISLTDFFENLVDIGYELFEEPENKKGSYFKSGEILTLFPLGS